MDNNRLRNYLIWGYVVELLAAFVLTAMLYVAVRNDIISFPNVIRLMNRAHDVLSQIATAGAVTWVILLGLPFGLIAFLGDEFKDFLIKTGAVAEYVKAYVVASVSFALAFVLVTKCEGDAFNLIVSLTVFIFFYAFINIITVLTNALSLIRLAQKFRQLKDKQ